MTRTSLHPITIGLLLLVGVAAPLLFPAYTNQIAVLWLMIVFAMTWDTLGGQMGYNSLGNIFFFGAGMYVSAIVQIGLFYDVGMYTSFARGYCGKSGRTPTMVCGTVSSVTLCPSTRGLAAN